MIAWPGDYVGVGYFRGHCTASPARTTANAHRPEAPISAISGLFFYSKRYPSNSIVNELAENSR